jgi:hypothetical protein
MIDSDEVFATPFPLKNGVPSVAQPLIIDLIDLKHGNQLTKIQQ